MTTVGDVSKFINEFAPNELAEEWDNVGLLVGDPAANVERVMTCLTVTPESAAEAIAEKANVIITHHPMPFVATKRLTTEQTSSRLLLDLIKADIAIISPHTAFDSTVRGINAMLAERFRLRDVRPLIPSVAIPSVDPGQPVGAARVGKPASGTTLQSMIDMAKSQFDLPFVKYVGDPQAAIGKVAVCCGSGGSFFDKARQAGCDAMITGEAQFHTCLEAKANSVGLILLGHHASERFAVENLAEIVSNRFEKLKVWPSNHECNPVQFG